MLLWCICYFMRSCVPLYIRLGLLCYLVTSFWLLYMITIYVWLLYMFDCYICMIALYVWLLYMYDSLMSRCETLIKSVSVFCMSVTSSQVRLLFFLCSSEVYTKLCRYYNRFTVSCQYLFINSYFLDINFVWLHKFILVYFVVSVRFAQRLHYMLVPQTICNIVFAIM